MAAGAVAKIRDSLLAVLAFDLGGVVLVTGVAGIAGQGLRVAHPALRRLAPAVVEWEGVRLVEGRWFPSIGRVACRAFGAE